MRNGRGTRISLAVDDQVHGCTSTGGRLKVSFTAPRSWGGVDARTQACRRLLVPVGPAYSSESKIYRVKSREYAACRFWRILTKYGHPRHLLEISLDRLCSHSGMLTLRVLESSEALEPGSIQAANLESMLDVSP